MLHFSPFVRVLCLSLSGVKLGHSIVLLLRGAKGSRACVRILFLYFYFIFLFYILLYARFVSHVVPVSCPILGNSFGISSGNRIGFETMKKARKYQGFSGMLFGAGLVSF